MVTPKRLKHLRRQQPFPPFVCEDCATEKGKHSACIGCYLNAKYGD